MDDATSEQYVSLNDKDCPKIFEVAHKAALKMIKAIEADGYENATYEATHTFRNGKVYKLTLERIDQD